MMNVTNKTVGVKDTPPELAELDFRRDALLFDVVAVPMLGWQIRNLMFHLEYQTDDAASAKVAELEWLIDQGIIFEPPAIQKWPAPEVLANQGKTDALMRKFREAYRDYWKSKDKKSLEQAHQYRWEMCDIHSRFTAAELREHAGAQAYPILYSTRSFGSVAGSRETVLQIIFDQIPQPDPSTPWEAILSYRDDPETKYRMAGLHNWVAEVARGQLDGDDIRNKLAWELETYKRHMAVREMSLRAGRLEILVTTASEILEQLVRLKFGKALKTVFALRRKHLELVAEELSSPGRELGYILRTQNTFGRMT